MPLTVKVRPIITAALAASFFAACKKAAAPVATCPPDKLTPPGTGTAAHPVMPGDKAPDFTLATLEGKQFRLGDEVAAGRAVVLWFS